jgi:hypothetical protein
MPIQTATFTLTNEFSPAIDTIRQQGFPIRGDANTLRDSFDEENQSLHFLLQMRDEAGNDEIAVYQRFTNNLNGRKLIMEIQTNNKAPIPKTDEPLMEMGRFVIAPKFQNRDLLEPFLLMGFIYAYQAGYSKVVTSIRDKRNLIKRCETLGFTVQELVVDSHIPNYMVLPVRTLFFDLKEKGPALNDSFIKASTLLLEKQKIILNTSFIHDIQVPQMEANSK